MKIRPREGVIYSLCMTIGFWHHELAQSTGVLSSTAWGIDPTLVEPPAASWARS